LSGEVNHLRCLFNKATFNDDDLQPVYEISRRANHRSLKVFIRINQEKRLTTLADSDYLTRATESPKQHLSADLQAAEL
jgi:hypothetical protein